MTRIIVAFPKAENGKNIKNVLVRNGYQVVCVCTNGAQVIQEANGLQDGIVVCTYKLSDMIYQELVDRAKAILMERNQMTEDEAHRYLQKTSMDNGTSFTETAQMILGMLDQ